MALASMSFPGLMSIAGVPLPYPTPLRVNGVIGISGRLMEKRKTIYRYGI